MTRFRKSGWCVRCNAERPVRKASRVQTADDDGKARLRCAVCFDPVEMPTKFGNKPTRSKHTGRLIHSKKEAAWEPTLIALANAGQIRELRAQGPKYRFRVYSNGPVGELLAAIWRTRLADPQERDALLVRLVQDVERSMVDIPGAFIPDWTFHDTRDDRFHVHDVKGARTLQYRRHKALMLACFGVEVEEPEPGGVQQRARGAGIRGRGTGSRFRGGR